LEPYSARPFVITYLRIAIVVVRELQDISITRDEPVPLMKIPAEVCCLDTPVANRPPVIIDGISDL